MAKKKQTKKHRFKYAEPVTGTATTPAAVVTNKATTASMPTQVSDASSFAYVGRDVRRVGTLAGLLILLEVVLWWAFGHTGLGSAVYNLVHV